VAQLCLCIAASSSADQRNETLATNPKNRGEAMTVSMPKEVAGYVESINDRDSAAFIALFSTDARVDDAGREFRGTAEIKAWGEHDIFAPLVTLEVLAVAERDGQTIVTAKVDGNFDRTGLPDPVIIDHYFTLAGGKIVGLACRLAGGPPAKS
jgi:hypothetical protein